MAVVLARHQLGEFGRFGLGIARCRRGHRGQALHDGLRGTGGGVLGDVVGVMVIAQQLGALGAGAGKVQDDLAGVVLALPVARLRGLKQAGAGVRIGERGSQRLLRRGLQRHLVAAVVLLHRIEFGVIESGQLGGRKARGVCLQVFDDAAPECCLQRGDARVQFAQSRSCFSPSSSTPARRNRFR